MARRASKRPQTPFTHKLVLNQWLLSLFKVDSFEKLAEHLRDESLEGLDANNIHQLHHALRVHFPNLQELPADLLLEYDQNIIAHTQRLNDHRVARGEKPIVWKYFQYLALLFTEIYLDRYFRDPAGLLKSINTRCAAFNSQHAEADQIEPLDQTAEAWSQLNKLAYWMATGSGKTLLMHVNILQYRRALERRGRQRELNRILLLTPNEGLSQQHLCEFQAAGIPAKLFDKDSPGLFSGQTVEIVEITRLRDEMGDRTIAIDAFEGNNLVLVDEGHRGATSGETGAWMRARNALCEKGFSFEYSATFGQAIKGNPQLIGMYAKSTLFDYSYRYFYADGFGKDYQILNLDEVTQDNDLELYLVACLLSFFQQQRLYREQSSTFESFNIDKPLWVFVGGRVVKGKGLASKDASDIVQILKFLSRYVADRLGSIQRIRRVLHHGVVSAKGKNLFAERFKHLNTCGLSAEQVFEETLETLFNARGAGQLYVENLKGVAGEVALRLGAENEAFGVINVGDDTKLVNLCKDHGILTGNREFSGSLFHEIKQPQSKVNLLIGSKKFTEGWSSWRVSTMGLMNVGKGEGAQIIQLFGRGVRLKGYDLSLKRSGKMQLPEGVRSPKHIDALETLGIFGIQANYMAQFRDFLNEEGMRTNDDRLEFLLPIVKDLGKAKLKTIRLKRRISGVNTVSGNAFRTLAPVPTVGPLDPESDSSTEYLQKNKVVLNWYPKIQAMKSRGLVGGESEAVPFQTHLTPRNLAFLNLDRIYFDLERFKTERGWHNLNISRQSVEALLNDQSWYRLEIPREEMVCDSYDKVRLWEEIALALLKKFTERFYTFRRREWELPHLEYRYVEEDDSNFPKVRDSVQEGYRILIDESREEIVAKLEELRAAIQKGETKDMEFQGMKALWFENHLYQPLLCLDTDVVEISPAPLNRGERQFIEDLKAFHDRDAEFFRFRELYLLRNLSKGRGIGFFEAGNFHPDFILWLIEGEKQHVIFVDPKGLRNIGPQDPKIQFSKTIKEVEQRLGDTSVQLHSFIVSNTPFETMRKLWSLEKKEMEEQHVLFQEEDQDTYVRTMLDVWAREN